jgi:hypothetical protein
MNLTKFEGDVNAPLFPGFYMVFKKEKVAFSLGINPIGVVEAPSLIMGFLRLSNR